MVIDIRTKALYTSRHIAIGIKVDQVIGQVEVQGCKLKIIIGSIKWIVVLLIIENNVIRDPELTISAPSMYGRTSGIIFYRIVYNRIINDRGLAVLYPYTTAADGGIVVGNNIVANDMIVPARHVAIQVLA
ncbi:hypothetical protein D3C80_1197390 [compost metagenome]